jgi:hypothetical protein
MVISEHAARHTPFPPPLWGRANTTNTGVPDLPPSLTLPHKGGGDGEGVQGRDKVFCSSFIRP